MDTNDTLHTINPIHADGLLGLFTPIEPSGLPIRYPLAKAMANSVQIHTELAIAELLISRTPIRDRETAEAHLDRCITSQQHNDVVLHSYGLIRNFGSHIPVHLLNR